MRMMIPMQCAVPAPVSAFRDLEEHLERIWNGMRTDASTAGTWAPLVDVHETAENFVLEADLPGMNKEDIDVTLDNGTVTVKGSRKQEVEENGKGFHRVERRYGRCERAFRLPKEVDAEKIKAEFEKGVLRVTLPKREEAKPKQIQVQIH